MGCLVRLGCLVILLLLAIVAWLTSDRWLPMLTGRHAAVASAGAAGWEPITGAGAKRADAAMSRLSGARESASTTLSAGDAASYIFKGILKVPAEITDSMQAMASGDHVSVRGNIPVRALGDTRALGPLATLLRDREQVELTGTTRMIGPRIAIFQVQDLKLRGLKMPHALIPRLVRQLGGGRPPAGSQGAAPAPDDAVPFPVPAGVSDIHVSNGRIILSKSPK